MNKLIVILILSISISSFGKSNDSLQVQNLASRIIIIENQVKEIRRDELNYKIEKDLLKETYSNNYERINTIISIVLGVIGVLAYLGIRDISSIKKEYEKELNSLKETQNLFKSKSEELDKDKKKIDEDLKAIIRENEEQSRRIKFIELKEKIPTLIRDRNLTSALDFSNAALNIVNNDIDVLNYKGTILCKLNQLNEAVDTFQLALEINPNDLNIKFNSCECFFFAKEFEKAEKIIGENKVIFENKESGALLDFFKILKLYHESKKEELLEVAKNFVNVENIDIITKKMQTWNLDDAQFFAHHQEEGELKNILKNLIWYLDGQIDGRLLLTRLNLSIPTK